jgi:hypothetical protein
MVLRPPARHQLRNTSHLFDGIGARSGRKDRGRFGKPRNSVGVATFGRPMPVRTITFSSSVAGTEVGKASDPRHVSV